MDPYEKLASYSRRILDLQVALRYARSQRDAALVAIHESGVPKVHVVSVARLELLQAGFSMEEIDRMALSPASVRLVLDRPRDACAAPSPALPSAAVPLPAADSPETRR
jgi:hypothetical protein